MEMLLVPLINITPSVIVPDELSIISACANAIIPDDMMGSNAFFAVAFLEVMCDSLPQLAAQSCCTSAGRAMLSSSACQLYNTEQCIRAARDT